MTRTIVFLHGAWMTPHCWDTFKADFEARGYRCIAPAWPGKDRSVVEVNADPSSLAGVGIAEIVEHYASVIRGLDEPPILIGHSFGGLFTQILLDRGLGAAGVVLDPAAPRSVFAFEPSAFRSLASVLFTWRGWRKVLRWSPAQFRYAFVHNLSEADAKAAYDEYVTPETGRIFFQAAYSMLNRNSPARVDFRNAARAPLLIIAGEVDHIVPIGTVRRNYKAYGRSTARTDFLSFPGRTHWLIAQDGWQEIAQAAADWIEQVAKPTD
jgi:pimeloyl-ACP methyl ester carboxylesterase